MRAPPGFKKRAVPAGTLLVRDRDEGWVILAGEPPVKLDNLHADRRPHLHIGGWVSDDRRYLREGLTAAEAEQAVWDQLNAQGYLDIEALLEVLS